eukprot:1159247-Pelagomonas_calceolata.AAC.6
MRQRASVASVASQVLQVLERAGCFSSADRKQGSLVHWGCNFFWQSPLGLRAQHGNLPEGAI